MKEQDKTLAIILSGGAGKRIGGQDKGLLLYRGQPLISHVVTAIEPQVQEIVLCIHRNLDAYKNISANFVVDDSIEFEGPMAGVSAALNDLRSKTKCHEFRYLAIFPCDVPHLRTDHVARLRAELEAADADVAVAHDGRRRQNLHCLIRASKAQSLMDFYKTGGRAMHRWFDTVSCVDADFTDSPESFLNLNTAAQLTAAKS